MDRRRRRAAGVSGRGREVNINTPDFISKALIARMTGLAGWSKRGADFFETPRGPILAEFERSGYRAADVLAAATFAGIQTSHRGNQTFWRVSRPGK